MNISAKLRISSRLKASIHREAEARGISVSAVIREQMRPYLDGSRDLPQQEANDQMTTFSCPVEDFSRFKTLATDSGYGWDAAIRLIIEDYLATNQSNT